MNILIVETEDLFGIELTDRNKKDRSKISIGFNIKKSDLPNLSVEDLYKFSNFLLPSCNVMGQLKYED